jgi:hypothetical protein
MSASPSAKRSSSHRRLPRNAIVTFGQTFSFLVGLILRRSPWTFQASSHRRLPPRATVPTGRTFSGPRWTDPSASPHGQTFHRSSQPRFQRSSQSRFRRISQFSVPSQKPTLDPSQQPTFNLGSFAAPNSRIHRRSQRFLHSRQSRIHCSSQISDLSQQPTPVPSTLDPSQNPILGSIAAASSRFCLSSQRSSQFSVPSISDLSQ